MQKNAPQWIEIAVPVTFASTLTYQLPPEIKFDPGLIGKRALIPFRNSNKVGVILKPTPDNGSVPKKVKSVIEIMDDKPFIDQRLLNFYQMVSNYYLTPLGEVIFSGIPKWFRSTHNKPLPKESWWRVRQELPQDRLNSISSAKQRAIFEYVQTHGPIQSKSMTHVVKDASTQCKALLKKGLLLQAETAFSQNQAIYDPQFELTTDQANAYKVISECAEFKPFLLDGITGSGKTEVYIRLIQDALLENKQTLVLVPEIGLTPQLFHEISKRIDGKVAVLHSGLSDAARAKSWMNAKNGFYDVIVATRSGIFTPFINLGLIIIDEEHDLSFKQQTRFRYSARDLAVLRAKTLNIPVILGSATPALETFKNAQSRKYHWLKLRQRTNQRDLPQIQVHDTRQLKINKGLSHPVIESIKSELNKGQQTLLFLNRRGWSPKFHCQECSWVAECQSCDSYLTYHKHLNRLKCHHCDRHYSLPEFCPQCGSQKVKTMGVGTEKIEAGLKASIPDAHVIRVDRDTVKTSNQWQSTIDEIKSGIPCVMIGTQMLSKGHDFPNLTLVIIVNVDNSFFSLDFRATEHLSQLIVQVAGRAGRNQHPGRVIIQTQQPDNPFFEYVLNKSYEDFASFELKQRERMNFPPSSYMAILRCRSKDENQVLKFFEDLNASVRVPESLQCYGPLPAPVLKKMGQFNYQLIMSSPQRKSLHDFMKHLLEMIHTVPNAQRVHWNLDIDPIHLE